MVTTCSVVGCKNRFKAKGRRKFLRFPVDPDRRAEWMAAVNRLSKNGEPWTPSIHNRVCSDHFLGEFGLKSKARAFDPSTMPAPVTPAPTTEAALTCDPSQQNEAEAAKTETEEAADESTLAAAPSTGGKSGEQAAKEKCGKNVKAKEEKPVTVVLLPPSIDHDHGWYHTQPPRPKPVKKVKPKPQPGRPAKLKKASKVVSSVRPAKRGKAVRGAKAKIRQKRKKKVSFRVN